MLALTKALICIKVKVTGSKVKVKSGVINKTCVSSKSRTESRILTKLTLNVNINKVVILVTCQGHRVKGHG